MYGVNSFARVRILQRLRETLGDTQAEGAGAAIVAANSSVKTGRSVCVLEAHIDSGGQLGRVLVCRRKSDWPPSRQSGKITPMKKILFVPALLAAALLSACATATPLYGPVTEEGGVGYTSQQIETGRMRVTYTHPDPARAHDLALLRAAELTQMAGGDWFQVTHRYTEYEGLYEDRPRTSVSIGGSSGSYGTRTGVGLGVSLPIGPRQAATATDTLEIIIGAGPKPEATNVYDAQSVDLNLRGSQP